MSSRTRSPRALVVPARPRWGFLDALIVAVAVFGLWTRTPVGGLGQWTVAWMRGDAHHQADLLGFFRSEGPPKAWLDGPVTLPPTSSSPAGAFPEPWRTAVVRGLPDDLPAHTTSLLGPGDLPAGERLLTWLDTNWDGDPERALELAAIGPELRDRAIDRARAAGEAEPERFHAHRRYLPEATEREAGALIDSVLALAVVFDLHWPVDGSVRISSPFGDRVHPVLRTRKFHNGVDLPVPVGTPIHAAQEGVIVAATEDRTSGMYVIVEHVGGIRTAYCHLSRLPTKGFGERVERGEWIGDSGNTGRSTGPHLHFVLRVDGTPIDPAPYRRVAGS